MDGCLPTPGGPLQEGCASTRAAQPCAVHLGGGGGAAGSPGHEGPCACGLPALLGQRGGAPAKLLGPSQPNHGSLAAMAQLRVRSLRAGAARPGRCWSLLCGGAQGTARAPPRAPSASSQTLASMHASTQARAPLSHRCSASAADGSGRRCRGALPAPAALAARLQAGAAASRAAARGVISSACRAIDHVRRCKTHRNKWFTKVSNPGQFAKQQKNSQQRAPQGTCRWIAHPQCARITAS